MSEIPPNQTGFVMPGPPPPIQQPRLRRIWPMILLFAIFAIHISFAVASLSKDGRRESLIKGLDQSLKFALLSEATSSFAPARTTAKTDNAALEKVVKEAAEFPENPEAARVQLAAQFELKQKPAETALATLRNSKEGEDQNVARIYESDKMTPDQAAMWSPTSKSFASKLIRAHAHQKAGNTSIRDQLVSLQTYLPMLVFMTAGMFALAIGVAVLGLFYWMSRRGSWTFAALPIPDAVEADRWALRGALAMTAFLIVGLFAGVAMIGLKSLPLSQEMANLAMQVGWLAATLAIIVMPLWDKGHRVRDLLGPKIDGGKRLLFGMGGYFANIPLLMLSLIVLVPLSPYLPAPTHPLTQEVAEGGPAKIIFAFISAAVFAPIIEEIIFRGMVLRGLMGLFGRPWPAIILQGFLFAAIHPQGPAGWLPLMILGGMCGWLTYRSGSIVPAIILHAVHNGLIVTFITFAF